MERLIVIIFFIFIIPMLEAQSAVQLKRVKRIVGGEDDVLREDFPYLVSLGKRIGGKYKQFCGGSIIDPEFILTAAHCVKQKRKQDIQVAIGITDLDIIENGHPEFTRNVISMYSHKDYNVPEQYANDIALIKVDKPIVYDNVYITSINLPEQSEPVVSGTKVWISGWGRIYGPDAPLSSTLRATKVTVIDHDVCVTTYKNYKRAVFPNQFCAHETDKNDTLRKGVCNADSGGPVAIVTSGKSLQIGIISWALKDPDCASPKFPDVYTKVSDHVNWIYKQMDHHRKPKKEC